MDRLHATVLTFSTYPSPLTEKCALQPAQGLILQVALR